MSLAYDTLPEWQDIPDNLKSGRYIVSCETDDGPLVCEMFRTQGKWEYEGQYTFQHSFYINPVKYINFPTPHKG